MKRIVVEHIESGTDKREYTLLTTVKEIDEHINLEIGCVDALDIVRDRDVNYNRWNHKDPVGLLMDNYKWINEKRECTLKVGDYGSITLKGFYDKATLNRTDILVDKRDTMVEILEEFGQIWLNDNGTYCTPLKGYGIVEF